MPEFLEEIPLFERNNIIFQQDGAGPHNARIVTNYLNQQFPGRWMGRYGPIHWPARSPDLNPLDFFLWGYCKEIVYKKLPETVDDLDAKLHEAI
ncbi:transposable element tc3 transposase [Lasius niger]|uniref:Transposable element tc3 transposase n=1 Tax=Lasius niger TaxID=67767 RepID=A0A0J7JVA7_LASNI|nr:transposable element tc3 transposase [Lasius niger]